MKFIEFVRLYKCKGRAFALLLVMLSAKCLKFTCDEQGAVRQTILYANSFFFFFGNICFQCLLEDIKVLSSLM